MRSAFLASPAVTRCRFAWQIFAGVSSKFAGDCRFTSAEQRGDFTNWQTLCSINGYLFSFLYVKMFVTHGLSCLMVWVSMLIETSKPIQDIGEELGFVSSAHFSKMFKKYVGITPKEYQNHFIDRKSFFGTTHYYANHSRLYKNFFRGGFLNSKHSQNCDNVRAEK